LPDLRPALARLDADGLAALLRDVPCLADAVEGRGPLAPTWPIGVGRRLDRHGLAQLLATPTAIEFTVASLDAPAFALAQLAAWYGGTLTREQAIAEAPGVDPAELDAAAETLRQRLLTAQGGWLRLREAVADEVHLPGMSAAASLQYLGSDHLAERLRALGQPVPARRAQRVEAIVAALRDPDIIEGVVRALPADAGRLLAILAEHGPQRLADVGVPRWPPYGRQGSGLVTLVRSGLAIVDVEDDICMLWLDTLVGLRGGRLFGDEFPAAPDPTPVRLSTGPVALPPVLEHFDAVLSHWRARPAEALTAGGLGVRPVRAAAKSLGIPSPQVGLLASLAAEIGLLGLAETGATGRGRNRTVHRQWAPTVLADEWAQQPPARQWAQLVHTWRASPRAQELDGLPERFEPDEMADDATAVVARALWLRLLTDLPESTGIAEDDLHDVAAGRSPMLLDDRGWVDGLLAASRALGLVPPSGPVGLTAAARAALSGPEALEALLPAPSTEIIVQADMTVVVPPDAAPELTATLARWADLESAAGARTYRLSERRLAAALAAGADDDEILAWLVEHSRVGVPQNVDYLIRDLARRRGQVRAGSAASYLRCDDAALLTQAMAVRAAKLRMLAPTVAVSPLPCAKLLAALADRGVAAVAEDASGAVVEAAPPEAERVGWHHSGAGLPDLHPTPEPAALAARLTAAAPSEPAALAARLTAAAPSEDSDDPIALLRRREQKLRAAAEANGQQELL
jgi:hypothetical protein